MSSTRRVIRVLGGLACVGCVAWIGWRMHHAGVFSRLARGPNAASLWRHIALAAALYGASMMLLAFAWHAMLNGLGAGHVAIRRSLGIYATSQFGKYFPGSVLQYVGRHTMFRQVGLPHRLLLLCTILEAVLLVAAALFWAAPLAGLYIRLNVASVWVSIAVGLVFVGWLLRTHAKRLGVSGAVSLRWLSIAFVCYLVFFGLMGLTFDLASSFAETSLVMPVARYATVAASWIAGFVIVGAPAGIGVREAVFLALMGGALSGEATLSAVSAFRVATFGGDLLTFALGWLLLAGARANASNQS